MARIVIIYDGYDPDESATFNKLVESRVHDGYVVWGKGYGKFAENCFILRSGNKTMELLGELKKIIEKGILIYFFAEEGELRIWPKKR